MRTRRSTPARNLREHTDRRAHALAEQAHWESIVEQAAVLHGFEYTVEDWPALADWYAGIPSTPPSRREQDRWLREQQVLASWRAA